MEKAKAFVTVLMNLDIDANHQWAEPYQVMALPVVVFADGEGKERGRFVGLKSPQEVLKVMDEVLVKAKPAKAENRK